MATSRIFIKGLPPTFKDDEFKKHFSQSSPITDAKIFQNRRIGYVGYRTPEDAQKAIKYFNKSFIRMSKIGVELARPVQEAQGGQEHAFAPTVRRLSKPSSDETEEKALKRKRSHENDQTQDPKLKEFLDVMKPRSKRKTWEEGTGANVVPIPPKEEAPVVGKVENASDEEYEEVPRKARKTSTSQDASKVNPGQPSVESLQPDTDVEVLEDQLKDKEPSQNHPTVSDSDWARSRTSRLLGLLDDDEEDVQKKGEYIESIASDADPEPEKGVIKSDQQHESGSSLHPPPLDNVNSSVKEPLQTRDVETVRSSMRLFVRNLPYGTKEEDLEAEFEPYGNLEEVHVPLDSKTGVIKGFAYVQFSSSDSAEIAMKERDGHTFQGRLLHILPADPKRETKLVEFALSKLPLKKQQQLRKKREASTTAFNWNALYMNADSVVASVADRLGLSKSEVLDPTSSDAAIKQAHAETNIIQETKAYYSQHGVDLDSFKKSQRGDTAILIKNIPYDCSKDELTRLFEEHGELKRFLMPPSGVIAIVEFANAAQCKTAFGALAYRKMKSSVLFLEKAPKDLFDAKSNAMPQQTEVNGVTKTSTSDLKGSEQARPDTAGTATLFVRNLNFSTTSSQLTETFKPLEGCLSARVKTRTDPKRPDEILSMGFGFIEFRNSQQAKAALQVMDGYTLEGHKLQIRASHKGVDAAEERRRADAEKRAAGKRTKVVIKNLPFEATKKDVRALFGAYGQLRSVRVPKKMDRAARGFAFADFTTPKEAESAMNALKDTHLLGRRLVLDFAEEDPEDAEAEIEKMQQKIGSQINKVALQKLTSGGRKKFTTQEEDAE